VRPVRRGRACRVDVHPNARRARMLVHAPCRRSLISDAEQHLMTRRRSPVLILLGCYASSMAALVQPSPLAMRTAPASRRRSEPVSAAAADTQRWVLGMNKYSHDAGVCLLSLDGERSIIVPKERVTRVKHDGGDCAAATQHALEAVGATLDDVVVACANNHHFRIAPFEKRAPWQTALGINFGVESTVSPYNLLPTVPRHEVSHHLAHAWSVLTQAPFDEGLIVVMDGMGELREEMIKALATHEVGYHTDELLPVEDEASGGFQEVPAAFDPLLSYREAESERQSLGPDVTPSTCRLSLAIYSALGASRRGTGVYSFKGTELKRVFKRWQPHNSPPTLYNHVRRPRIAQETPPSPCRYGFAICCARALLLTRPRRTVQGFENMESLGAVYSRVSSHVFGDWNACGKVMGLAPWAAPWTMAAATAAEKAAAAAATGGASGSDADGGGGVGGAREGEVQLFHGSLDGVGDDALRVDWAAIEALPHPNGWRGLPDGYAPIVGTAEEAGVAAPQQTAAQQEALDAEEARVAAEDAEVRAFLASLSLSTQAELERVAVDFLARLQKRTGAKNLCLAGGVALNSVLNGRLAREAGELATHVDTRAHTRMLCMHLIACAFIACSASCLCWRTGRVRQLLRASVPWRRGHRLRLRRLRPPPPRANRRGGRAARAATVAQAHVRLPGQGLL